MNLLHWMNEAPGGGTALSRKQIEHLLGWLKQYDDPEVFLQFGVHPYGQQVVVLHLEEDGKDSWDAFWLDDDGCVFRLTDEEIKTGDLPAELVDA